MKQLITLVQSSSASLQAGVILGFSANTLSFSCFDFLDWSPGLNSRTLLGVFFNCCLALNRFSCLDWSDSLGLNPSCNLAVRSVVELDSCRPKYLSQTNSWAASESVYNSAERWDSWKNSSPTGKRKRKSWWKMLPQRRFVHQMGCLKAALKPTEGSLQGRAWLSAVALRVFLRLISILFPISKVKTPQNTTWIIKLLVIKTSIGTKVKQLVLLKLVLTVEMLKSEWNMTKKQKRWQPQHDFFPPRGPGALAFNLVY